MRRATCAAPLKAAPDVWRPTYDARRRGTAEAAALRTAPHVRHTTCGARRVRGTAKAAPYVPVKRRPTYGARRAAPFIFLPADRWRPRRDPSSAARLASHAGRGWGCPPGARDR